MNISELMTMSVASLNCVISFVVNPADREETEWNNELNIFSCHAIPLNEFIDSNIKIMSAPQMKKDTKCHCCNFRE